MKMRRLAFIGIVALWALALSAIPPCSRPLLAQSGCCKERQTLTSRWVRRPDVNFTECRKLNQKKDGGDNIFEQAGLVWWDRDCT
jgi:hypothetical protein